MNRGCKGSRDFTAKGVLSSGPHPTAHISKMCRSVSVPQRPRVYSQANCRDLSRLDAKVIGNRTRCVWEATSALACTLGPTIQIGTSNDFRRVSSMLVAPPRSAPRPAVSTIRPTLNALTSVGRSESETLLIKNDWLATSDQLTARSMEIGDEADSRLVGQERTRRGRNVAVMLPWACADDNCARRTRADPAPECRIADKTCAGSSVARANTRFVSGGAPLGE